MTGTMQQRRVALLVALVGLLVAVGAGVGHADDAAQFRGRSQAAVSATGAFGSSSGGAPDTRVQRHLDAGQGQRTSDHVGLGNAPSRGQSPAAVVAALASVLERAGHPERLGHILLRGPPGPSA
jgi:hypothetical protein